MIKAMKNLTIRGRELAFGLVIYGIAASNVALAAVGGTAPPIKPGTTGPTTGTELYGLGVKLVNWFFAFVILIGIAMIILSGLEYMTASRAGDKDKAGGAKSRIVWVAIGVAIVFLAWLVVTQIIPDIIGAEQVAPPRDFR